MPWPIHTAALVSFVVLYDWVLLRAGRHRIGVAWPAMIAALGITFTVPTDAIYVRAIAACVSLAMAVRSYELERGLRPDPRILERPELLALWLLLPPDARTPTSPAEIVLNRRHGRRRLLRAFAKATAAWGLFRLHELHPEIHDHLYLETFWAMWLIYVGVSGLADAMSGIAMQTGLHVDEIFDTPVLARSPRDFWARRWNLVVHQWALRNLFVPLGGRRRPLLATVIVFGVSGLVHEYVVFACLGRLGSYTGWMMAFFSLQAVGVVGQTLLRRHLGKLRMPTVLAVLLHLAWMVLTAPIFIRPLGEVFG